MAEQIDMREGFRIEVERMILPQGSYGARLYRPKVTPSGRTTWKQVGSIVINYESAGDAAMDLLRALNIGAMPEVEAADGR